MNFCEPLLGDFPGFALGFQDAPRLPLHSEPTAVLGERPGRTEAAWLLVVDDDRHPLGWVEPVRIGDILMKITRMSPLTRLNT